MSCSDLLLRIKRDTNAPAIPISFDNIDLTGSVVEMVLHPQSGGPITLSSADGGLVLDLPGRVLWPYTEEQAATLPLGQRTKVDLYRLIGGTREALASGALYCAGAGEGVSDLGAAIEVPGQQGAAGTVEIAATVTLPAGEPAYVENTGTPEKAVLTLYVPQGAAGDVTPAAIAARNAAVSAADRSETGADRAEAAAVAVPAIELSLKAPTQIIGYPGELPTGTNSTRGTYAFDRPIARSGVGLSYRYRCLVAGTIWVQIARWSGPQIMVIDERMFAASVGEGEVLFTDLAYTAGDLVGVRFEQNGRLAGQSGSTGGADGWRYIVSQQGKGTSWTPTLHNQTVGVVHSYGLLEQTATGPKVLDLEQRLDAIEGSGAPETYHLHWAIGESHVAGAVTTLSAITLPVGYGYNYRRATETLGRLQDPTGNVGASVGPPGRGSMYPAMGAALLRLTGGRTGPVIINSGSGGTTVGTHWAPSGIAWTQAVGDWGKALTAVKANEIIIAGVSVSIDIGSNDAQAGTTKANYKAQLLSLIARIRTLVGAGDDLPIILVQTGPYADGSYGPAVKYIQEAQAEICREVAGIYMAYSARYSVARGQMIDNVHMTQAWNDIAGAAIAGPAVAHGTGKYPAGLD